MRSRPLPLLGIVALCGCISLQDAKSDEITIEKDNIKVTGSVKIKPGTYRVVDSDKNGVLQVEAEGVTVDFQGATLWGVLKDENREAFDGIGISVKGCKNVTIKNANVHGFKYNIQVLECNKAVVEGCDVAKSRAMRISKYGKTFESFLELRKLQAWRGYGASIWLEKCTESVVKKCVGRSGQNGILLVDSERCEIRENDFSFSSGWGIGLWHSSNNKVLANTANFVDRPWSGSWGGDAQGIVLVDGSNANWVVGNSFSHGGYFLTNRDNKADEKSKADHGASNDNIVAYNDCSYVHANSFESTFSDGNIFVRNTASNSNFGFWLGYSSNNMVLENEIIGNKTEGVAVEHGSGTVIEGNNFSKNGQAGIRLWNGGSKHHPSKSYTIRGNKFVNERDCVVLAGTDDTVLEGNQFIDPTDWAIILDKDSSELKASRNIFKVESGKGGAILSKGKKDEMNASENYWDSKRNINSLIKTLGGKVKTDNPLKEPPKPVSLSASEKFWSSERGKKLTEIYNGIKDLVKLYKDTPYPKGWHIFTPDEWSPYDFTKDLVYPAKLSGGPQTLYVLGGGQFKVEQLPNWLKVSSDSGSGPGQIQLEASKRPEKGKGDVRDLSFKIKFPESGKEAIVSGTLTMVEWDVKYFKWNGISYNDKDGWEKLFKGKPVYSHGSPTLDVTSQTRPSQVPDNHFAIVAEADIEFPGGDVLFKTISDDGVRLYVDDKAVISNWSRHAGKTDTATVNMSKGRHNIRVEYCQEGGGYRLLANFTLVEKEK